MSFALVQTGPKGENAPEVRHDAPRDLRKYDFRRPGKFTKEQLRTLHLVHENFARLLTTFFSTRFRARVNLSVQSVEPSTYEEYIQGVSTPAVLFTFSAPPLPGACLINLDPRVAFPILDLLFGGPGALPSSIRSLTDIEGPVLARVMGQALKHLADAWKNIADLRPELGMLETNPLFIHLIPPAEIMATVTIATQVGDHRGHMDICLPVTSLEPVLERLASHATQAAAVAGEWSGSGMRESLGGAPVAVAARLGSATLSIGELLALTPGDIVLLDRAVDEPVTVLVGGRPTFQGRPGTVRGRMAVEIAAVCDRGDDGHDA